MFGTSDLQQVNRYQDELRREAASHRLVRQGKGQKQPRSGRAASWGSASPSPETSNTAGPAVTRPPARSSFRRPRPMRPAAGRTIRAREVPLTTPDPERPADRPRTTTRPRTRPRRGPPRTRRRRPPAPPARDARRGAARDGRRQSFGPGAPPPLPPAAAARRPRRAAPRRASPAGPHRSRPRPRRSAVGLRRPASSPASSSSSSVALLLLTRPASTSASAAASWPLWIVVPGLAMLVGIVLHPRPGRGSGSRSPAPSSRPSG